MARQSGALQAFIRQEVRATTSRRPTVVKPENVAIVFEARVISGANNRNPSVGELSAWKHQLTSLAKEFGGSANVDKIQRVKTIDDKPAFIVGFHIPSCNQQAFREAVDNGTFVIQESPKVAGFNTLGETRAGVQRDKAVKVEPQAFGG